MAEAAQDDCQLLGDCAAELVADPVTEKPEESCIDEPAPKEDSTCTDRRHLTSSTVVDIPLDSLDAGKATQGNIIVDINPEAAKETLSEAENGTAEVHLALKKPLSFQHIIENSEVKLEEITECVNDCQVVEANQELLVNYSSDAAITSKSLEVGIKDNQALNPKSPDLAFEKTEPNIISPESINTANSVNINIKTENKNVISMEVSNVNLPTEEKTSALYIEKETNTSAVNPTAAQVEEHGEEASSPVSVKSNCSADPVNKEESDVSDKTNNSLETASQLPEERATFTKNSTSEPSSHMDAADDHLNTTAPDNKNVSDLTVGITPQVLQTTDCYLKETMSSELPVENNKLIEPDSTKQDEIELSAATNDIMVAQHTGEANLCLNEPSNLLLVKQKSLSEQQELPDTVKLHEVEEMQPTQLMLPDSTNPEIDTVAGPEIMATFSTSEAFIIDTNKVLNGKPFEEIPFLEETLKPQIDTHCDTSSQAVRDEMAPQITDIDMFDQAEPAKDKLQSNEIIEGTLQKEDILSKNNETKLDGVLGIATLVLPLICEQNKPEHSNENCLRPESKQDFPTEKSSTETSINVNEPQDSFLNTSEINFNNLECDKQINEKSIETEHSQTVNLVEPCKDILPTDLNSMEMNICDAGEKITNMNGTMQAGNKEKQLKNAISSKDDTIDSSDHKSLMMQAETTNVIESNKDDCNTIVIESKPEVNINLEPISTPVKTNIKSTEKNTVSAQEIANIKVIKIITNAGVSHYIRVSSNLITEDTGKKLKSPTIAKVESPENIEEIICTGCDTTLTKRGMYHPCSENFCRFCQVALASRSEFELHTLEKHLVNMRTCSFCETVLASLQLLEMHLRSHTALRLAPSVCVGCRTMFRTNEGRKQHECGTPLLCRPCNVIFPSEVRLTDHQTAQHRLPSCQEDPAQASPCLEEKTEASVCKEDTAEASKYQNNKTQSLTYLDNTEATPCLEDKTEASPCLEDKTEASPCLEDKIEASPCLEDKTEASPCLEDKTEASPCLEDKIEASPCLEDKTEASPCLEDKIEASPCLEDKTEASPCLEDKIEASPCLEDKTEASPCLEDKIEASPCLEDKTEASPCLENKIEASPCLEDETEASPCLEDKTEASPCLEDKIEASPCLEDKTEASPCLEDKIEASPCLEDKTEASPCLEDKIEASPCLEDKTEASPCLEDKIEALPGEGAVKKTPTMNAGDVEMAAVSRANTPDKCGPMHQCDICDLELPTEGKMLSHRAWHFESCAAPPGQDVPSSEQTSPLDQDDPISEQTVSPGQNDPISEQTPLPNQDDPSSEQNVPPNQDDPSSEQNVPPNQDDPSSEQNVPPNQDDPSSEQTVPPNQDGPISEQNVPPNQDDPSSEQNVPPNQDDPSSEQNVPPNQDDPISEQNVPPNQDGPISEQNVPPNQDDPSSEQNVPPNQDDPISKQTSPPVQNDSSSEQTYNFTKNTDEPENKIKCLHCDLLFSQVSNLNAHLYAEKFCKLCPLQLGQQTEYELHMVEYHSMEKICQFCDKEFRHSKDLSSHLKSHTQLEFKPFTCLNCNTVFNKTDYLKHNKCRATNNSPSVMDLNKHCDICKIYFQNDGSLENHMIENHSNKDICPICNQHFITISELIKHIESHASVTKMSFKCQKCQKSFVFESEFDDHDCLIYVPPIEDVYDIYQSQQCEMCNEQFSNEEDQLLHECDNEATEDTSTRNFCRMCNIAFEISSVFEKHMMEMHSTENMCQFCSKKFSYPQHLVNHIREHTKIKHPIMMIPSDRKRIKSKKAQTEDNKTEVYCKTCDITFVNRGNFELHMMEEHSSKKNCQFCNTSFKRYKVLKQHIQVHTTLPHQPFKCTECHDSFNKEIFLFLHQCPPSFPCDMCQQSFKTRTDLDVHDQQNHEFLCHLCERQFQSQRSFSRHLKAAQCMSTTSSSASSSEECNVENNSLNELNNYPLTSSSQQKREETKGKPKLLKCPQCTKVFSARNYLGMHLKSHAKKLEETILCKICQINFKSKDEFSKHECQEFLCKRCKTYFKDHSLYDEHMIENHSSTDTCQFCDKIFKTTSSLLSHLKTHTTMNFTCEVCKITVNSRKLLEKHNCNKKMYSCEICKKSFENIIIMKKHLIKDHSNHKKCSYCTKYFTSNKFLVVHVARFHMHKILDMLPFKCRRCSIKFGSNDDFSQHTCQKLMSAPALPQRVRNLSSGAGYSSESLIDAAIREELESTSTAAASPPKKRKYVKKKKLEAAAIRDELESSSTIAMSPFKKRKYNKKIKLATAEVQESKTKPSLNTALPCVHCNLSFNDTHSLNEHLIEVKFCKHCSKRFYNIKIFEAHMMSRHNVDKTCQFCDRKFKGHQGLVKHMTVHTKLKFANQNYCKICDKSFQNKNNFELHMMNDHCSDSVCQFCDLTFPNKNNLIEHIKLHTNLKHQVFYKCLTCNEKFNNKIKKKYHKCKAKSIKVPVLEQTLEKNKNTIKTPVIVKTTETTKNNLCSICDKKFPSKVSFEFHMINEHHNSSSRKCQICGLNCKSNQLLLMHFKEHTQMKYAQFKCSTCEVNFSTMSNLNTHDCKAGRKHKVVESEESVPRKRTRNDNFVEEATVSPPRLTREGSLRHQVKPQPGTSSGGHSIKCSLCSKTFPNPEMRLQHLQVHHRVNINSCEQQILEQDVNPPDLSRETSYASNDFECNHCNCTFLTTDKLRLHGLTVGVFCDICHLTYPSPAKYESHMLEQHSIGRTCKFCHTQFSNKTVLLLHLRKHSVVKPNYFLCCDCQGKYSSALELQRHTCLSYECEECDTKFESENQVQEHWKEVHESPRHKFQCEFCHKAFNTRVKLAEHVQENHSIGVETSSPGSSAMSAALASRGKKKQNMPQPRATKKSRPTNEDTEGSATDDIYEDFPLNSLNYPNCEHCNKIFPTTLALEKHINELTFQCKICLKKFMTNQERDDHREEQHADNKCVFCDKQFDKISSLTTHVTWHSRNSDFNDTSTTPSPKKAPQHFQVPAPKPRRVALPMPAPPPRFPCVICGKRMASKTALIQHQRVHVVYQCELCSRAFTSAQKLSAHIRLHAPPDLPDVKVEEESDDEPEIILEVMSTATTAPQGQFVLMN